MDEFKILEKDIRDYVGKAFFKSRRKGKNKRIWNEAVFDSPHLGRESFSWNDVVDVHKATILESSYKDGSYQTKLNISLLL